MLLTLAGYVVLYVVMRGSGVITHSWGVPTSKVSSPAYAMHSWECKSDVVYTAFAPMVVLEQSVRDLGGHKSP